eukprot:4140299-Prymnesium_polylepis.1
MSSHVSGTRDTHTQCVNTQSGIYVGNIQCVTHTHTRFASSWTPGPACAGAYKIRGMTPTTCSFNVSSVYRYCRRDDFDVGVV